MFMHFLNKMFLRLVCKGIEAHIKLELFSVDRYEIFGKNYS